MKPALSVIFFTVMSGAGLGLLIWLGLAAIVGTPIVLSVWRWALLVAVVLLTLGLLSSTLHLANPRNARFALRRFSSSWLSREGVFAVLLYPAIGLFYWAAVQWGPLLHGISAAIVVGLATAVLLATAMIYACLRTVPQWSNWQTRIGFPIYGLASGGLLMLALWPLRLPSGTATAAVLLLLLFGLVIKFHYYATFKRISAESPSVNEALKLGLDSDGAVQARVRMLDVGHTSGTFLTHEFGFELARRNALRLRLLALLLSFAAPIWLLLEGLPAWLAFAVCMLGLGVERWLFFAEARHVVRLYHG